jgi:hypothetical protein
VFRERYLLTSDARLGRHVNHDPMSRLYPVTGSAPIVSVKHERHIPVFDQGNLGSCTGNAAVGCMATGLFYASVTHNSVIPHYLFDETGAVACYSDATVIDDAEGYVGQYPPIDTGSDGLSVAKALQAHGEISGYLHAFSLDAVLQALLTIPVIVGVDWFQDMFNPDAEGIVHPTGALAGGHQFVADEIDRNRDLIGFTNSWGNGWGPLGGRFYMKTAEFGSLLAQNGDVTAFVPISDPAPVPVPPSPENADTALWATAAHWATVEHHVGDNAKAAHAVKTWATAKGFR